MVITITQEKKRQRYLLLALALIIFAILLVVWLGFFRKEESVLALSVPAAAYLAPEAEIDWQTLDELQRENLRPFKEIGAFKQEFGRENPFTPY